MTTAVPNIRKAGMNCNTWMCVYVCNPGYVCGFETVSGCVAVKIRKVRWELKGDVKYSCSTDSRLADSCTPGCSCTGMVATEVTSKEGMCLCTIPSLTLLVIAKTLWPGLTPAKSCFLIRVSTMYRFKTNLLVMTGQV